MNIKREYKYFFTLSILSLLFISLFSGFVSAEGIADSMKSFGSVIKDVGSSLFGWLLGNDAGDSNLFILRVFFFLIVFSFVFVVLEKVMGSYFDDNSWAKWIISIAIPAVAVRFLTKEWLYTILMPQQVLTASILIIIPFIIYFMVTMKFTTGYGRRAAWIVFSVVFLMIYITADKSLTTSNKENVANVYIFAALGGLLMAWFDGTIAKYTNKFSASKKMSEHDKKIVAHYFDEWNRAKEKYDLSIRNNGSYMAVTPGNTNKRDQKGFEADSKYYTDMIIKHHGRI